MNSTGSTRYAVWVCRQHLEDVRSCGMKSVREADLQRAFTIMINKLIFAKQEVLDTLLETLRSDVQKESLRQIDQIDHKLELNAERKKTLTTLMTRGYLEPKTATLHRKLRRWQQRRNDWRRMSAGAFIRQIR